MLEDRPNLQRALIGMGAFSFVFTAAMAGTAFMISGGFGLGGEAPGVRSVQTRAIDTQDAWNQWVQPAYAANQPVSTPTYEPRAAEPVSYTTPEDLEGEQRGAEPARVTMRSEADILREIERELSAYESVIAAGLDEVESRTPDYQPTPSEAAIIAAKERAAANARYGSY